MAVRLRPGWSSSIISMPSCLIDKSVFDYAIAGRSTQLRSLVIAWLLYDAGS